MVWRGVGYIPAYGVTTHSHVSQRCVRDVFSVRCGNALLYQEGVCYDALMPLYAFFLVVLLLYRAHGTALRCDPD